MKKTIKKYLPNFIVKLYYIICKRSNEKSNRQIFTEIYENNYWNSSESKSGEGSTINQTKTLAEELEKLFLELNIESFLDIPCGDYNWMQKVEKFNIKYVGADIVKPLIKANIRKFRKDKNCEFRIIDVVNDPLPKSDMVFVRDCFVHLPFQDILKSIQNIKKSGSKYLLTTTFPNHNVNIDSSNGGWRTINFQESPFNFKKPILIFNENSINNDPESIDKSMALWKIGDL